MKITVTEGRGNKLHIHIDGEYKATVDSDWWYSEKYRSLKDISENELTELLRSVSFRRAYNKGLDFLSRRMYGEKELFRKLKEKDFDEEAAAFAVKRLKELSLLDDEKYAEMLARHLYETKRYGEKRIRQELYFKGIDKETVENALLSLDKNDVNSIVLLLGKKFKNKLSDKKDREKAVASLLRYGYSYSDIKTAMEQYSELSEEDLYE